MLRFQAFLKGNKQFITFIDYLTGSLVTNIGREVNMSNLIIGLGQQIINYSIFDF